SPRPAGHNRSSRHSSIGTRLNISCAIGITATATRSVFESRPRALKNYSPAPESLAEPLRQTPDRLDMKRLLEPLRHPEREAFEANPGFVFWLLPWFPDRIWGSTSNGSNQISDAEKRSMPDAFVGQLGKPAFNQIQPTTTCRNVVDDKTW